ncbi:C-C motif chemokine 20-like [Mugil cephalus]|uniref:C-C motif chemokine 20-like n=1 Tax=Mugil cephalus TaxID=48193 RepID=UPI001FB653AE|nr:C-C motif chemokine 20-like [Mugil cephalus]
MAQKHTIALTTALLFITLGVLSLAPAARGAYTGKSCCTTYTRKPVPFNRVRGFREQSIRENCNIDAIIFYTVKNKEVCATRKDEWVKTLLKLLSSKLKKMSKTPSVAG